jgi:hypothetical protein
MRWRLGSFVFATLLISLALSSPASGNYSCTYACFQQYYACRSTCNSDPDCLTSCSDQLEYCRCGACGYCP